MNALAKIYTQLPPLPCNIISCGINLDAPYKTIPLIEASKDIQADVLLIYQPKKKLALLQIFNQALQYLKAGGQLMIVDHFATSVTIDSKTVNLLSDCLALAQRFNFHITCQAQYNYTNTLLILRLSEKPKWRLSVLTDNDIPQMLALFENTFHHKMTPALYQWKYAAELAPIIGIWEGHQLIASLGGMPREVLFFGKHQIVMQIGDVMVDVKKRGILSRTGPFFRMTATLLEQYAGFGKSFLCIYGFPNERHIKLAEHLGLYTEVGRMIALSWLPLTSRPRFMSHLQTVNKQNFETLAPHIDYLWQSMAADLKQSIIGQRNSHYLKQRYLDHPEQNYHLLLVKNRWSGRIYGLLVLQYKNKQCDIIDIIAHPKEIPLLILHARRMASFNQCQRLYCQITLAFSHYFKSAEHHVESLSIPIASDTWSHGPLPEELNNHWWLMAGDMDCR